MKRELAHFASTIATKLFAAVLLVGAVVAGPGQSLVNSQARPAAEVNAALEKGVASYYAHKYHGRTTANGEVFDMHALTAAHRTYRFGTRVKVTHLGNNRSVVVRINDRGPFVNGRIIDLSLAAAEELQMIESGLARVSLEILELPE
jgi:rare lipoprotein A